MKRYLILIALSTIQFLGTAQISHSAKKTVTPKSYLPKIHESDIIVEHAGYTLCYNEKHEQASWVAYELTAAKTNRVAERTNKFLSDPFVPTGSATDVDYKGSGYDRGHLAPAADMGWSVQTMAESFYYSNMSPQVPAFNRGIWKKLEEQVRDWAMENSKIEIVTGPVLQEGLNSIGPNRVSVPLYYYKVILDYEQPEVKCIGFLMPNEALSLPLQYFSVSVDSLERLTGIDFFPSLPNTTETQLESEVCIPCWDWNTHHQTAIQAKIEHQTLSGTDKQNNSSVQCTAITQKGVRCKRTTKDPSGRCWQHHD